MRPVKMTMSAFGPYAAETVVDFDTLGKTGVYLICGDTGAGKTMIFDAVSFALFGQASGDGTGARSTSSLRSDYAAPETATYVELEFEYRGKRYTVRRNPTYERPKKRGQGTTTEQTNATLTLPDGSVVGGATDVTKSVVELLGIDASQFKQIVMLAQGEFRKMLTAETREREAIFRNLFKTDRYELLSKLLANEHSKLANENETAKRRIADVANRASFPEGSDEALRLEELRDNVTELGPWLAEALDAFVREQKPACEKLQEEVDALLDQWHELDNLRKQALARPDAEKACEELERKIAEQEGAAPGLAEAYEAQKALDGRRAELDGQAAVIEGTFGKYQELEDARKGCAAARTAAESAAAAAKRAVEEHESAQAEHGNLSKAFADLQGADVRLVRADAEKREADNVLAAAQQALAQAEKLVEAEGRARAAEQTLEGRRGKLETAEAAQADAKAALEQAQGERAKLEGADVTLAQAQAASEHAAEVLAAVQGLIVRRVSLADSAEAAKEPYELKQAEYQEAEQAHGKDLRVLQDLQVRQRAGRAGLLAADLQEGSPCPVCGSTHHPAPACSEGDIPTDEDIDAASAREEASKRKATDLSVAAEGLRAVLQEKAAALAAFDEEQGGPGNLEAQAEDASERVKQAGLDLEDAQARKRAFDACVKAVNRAQSEYDAAAQAASAAKAEHQQASGAVVAARAQVETMRAQLEVVDCDVAREEQRVAVERRDQAANVLADARADAEKLVALGKQLEDSAAKLERAASEATTAQERSQRCNGDLKLKEGEVEHLQKDLEFPSLDAAQEQARNLRAKVQGMLDAREAARKAVEENAAATKSDKNLLEERRKTLAGIPELDIQAAEKQLDEIKQHGQRARADAVAAKSQLDANETCLNDLRQALDSIGDIAERYGRVKLLADAANGNLVGQKKMKFEPYVQGIYFDRVIRAANKRLKVLTDGQFELKRSVEGDGNAKTGLGLKVVDNRTCCSRDASSLSGGESFEASLCLALGLSDMVQAHSGGIEFDTMYVDEGFGSLDQSSLNNAITLLSDLSGGDKLIGIISHVEELKANIPKKVVVTKDLTGSSVTVEV